MKKPGTRLEVRWCPQTKTWRIALFADGYHAAWMLWAKGRCTWKRKAAAIAQANRFSKALGNIPVVVDE